MSKWHSTAISFKCYYLTKNIARLIHKAIIISKWKRIRFVCIDSLQLWTQTCFLFHFNANGQMLAYTALYSYVKNNCYTIPACCNKHQQSKSPQSNRVKKEQRLKIIHMEGVICKDRAIMSPMATSRSVYVERPVSWGTAAFRKKKKKKWNKWMDIFICKGENTVDRLPFKEGMHSCWNILGLHI